MSYNVSARNSLNAAPLDLRPYKAHTTIMHFPASDPNSGPAIVQIFSQVKERTLVCKCFLVGLKDGKFDIKGRTVGRREKPMAELTLRDAISHLAATFQANKWPGPARHEEEGVVSGPLQQSIKDLIM